MNHRRPILPIIALMAAAALGFSQQVVEEIVAVVNDEIITLTDFRKEYDQRLRAIEAQFQGEERDKAVEGLKTQLLDAMITDLLLLQMARAENINVADQVKTTIENIKKENEIESDEDLRRALAQQGMDYEAWLRQMEETILRQSVVFTRVNRSIVIDDAEIVEYYRKNQSEFVDPEEYTLQAVYLQAESRTGEELETLKAAIEAKVREGQDFATVAGAESDEPLKEAKGELGAFKKTELDPTLLGAIENLKKGEISGWVQNRNGWYLLRLEEKAESRLRTFDESRRTIEEKVFTGKQNVKMDEFFSQIKKTNYIKILRPNPIDDRRP